MARPDLVCFSHLRWQFVWQRPHHLMSRAAAERRVWFVEEPLFGEGPARLELSRAEAGVTVVTPMLPRTFTPTEQIAHQAVLVQRFLTSVQATAPVLWYCTPMARAFSRRLPATAVVYDCMDELAQITGAPPSLVAWERDLLARADVVFTCGYSLYEAKRSLHPNVHAFPSSVDLPHFAQARAPQPQPEDQRGIPHPRVGYVGAIDERVDRTLLAAASRLRPDLQFVLIGPIVRIDPASLPQAPNLHYLGSKQYEELPAYLAGWDVAMLPFARNDATRFISPTRTLEYLAAGRQVVSTAIRDVVRPYGERGYVHIADTPHGFVRAIAEAMRENGAARLARVDAFLADQSWDRTWHAMHALVVESETRRLQFASAAAVRATAERAAGPAA